MRCFMDWEFVENGPAIPIVPVSVALVVEDGREFYAINAESLSPLMRHRWTSVNLLPHLPIKVDSPLGRMGGGIYEWNQEHPDYGNVMPLDVLTQAMHNFIAGVADLELWADYGAYDHVVFAQTYGEMADLPPGVPMFTHELRQLIEEHPEIVLPPQPGSSAHHALADARWCRDAYNALRPPLLDDIVRHEDPNILLAVSIPNADGPKHAAEADPEYDGKAW